jgi:NTE family protein
MNYDFVCEGGGCKVPGLVGALHAIELQGYTPSHGCGTSAGAIVAACRQVGYTPEEMRNILMDMNFNSFKDGASWGRKTYNIWKHKGIYNGDVFYRTMQDLCMAKGIQYFGDLKDNNESNLKYRYKLKVFTADITNGRLVSLPEDARLYGLNPDYIEVAWAVRTSMSIPLYFRPVKVGDAFFVDGGLLSNYPIWTWDSHSIPDWPTFGVVLEEEDSNQGHAIKGNLSYLEAMVQTVLKAHDRRFIRPEDFKYRTIRVPVGDTKATDFGITAERKDRLYHNGFRAGADFLQDWRWDEYVEWASEARGIRRTGGLDNKWGVR